MPIHDRSVGASASGGGADRESSAHIRQAESTSCVCTCVRDRRCGIGPESRSTGGRRSGAEAHRMGGQRRTRHSSRSDCGSSGTPAAGMGRAQSRCRCGRREPSPGADVAWVGPVPVQMWAGVSPGPGADVAGVEPSSGTPSSFCRATPASLAASGKVRLRHHPIVSPAPAQMRAGPSAVPAQMWQG